MSIGTAGVPRQSPPIRKLISLGGRITTRTPEHAKCRDIRSLRAPNVPASEGVGTAEPRRSRHGRGWQRGRLRSDQLTKGNPCHRSVAGSPSPLSSSDRRAGRRDRRLQLALRGEPRPSRRPDRAHRVVAAQADRHRTRGTSSGFSWDGSAWHQIPVQVDERDLVSPGVIYHLPTSSYPKLYGTIDAVQDPRLHAAGVVHRRLHVVPHLHPARLRPEPRRERRGQLHRQRHGQAGRRRRRAPRPASPPSTRQVVTATDPLDPTHVGYVYLFHSDTLTGGSAGTTGVDYSFALDERQLPHDLQDGDRVARPEQHLGLQPRDSTVTTPGYTQTFGDRWLNDGLSIHKAGASGADLLDRSMYFATNAGVRPHRGHVRRRRHRRGRVHRQHQRPGARTSARTSGPTASSGRR